MRKNQDDQTEQSLRKLARNSRDAHVRGEALAALGNYPNAATSEFTAVLRSDRNPQVRAGAAKALVRRKDRNAIPDLYAALRDKDEKVRAWAISAIKEITLTGFLYNPGKQPHEQIKVMQQIGNYLRRNGFM